MSRFYITTAIPYANGAPHIGHAYERIATDAIQRFMRLDGRETLFVTGMDEYGRKVQQTAAGEGVSPQATSTWNPREASSFSKADTVSVRSAAEAAAPHITRPATQIVMKSRMMLPLV